MDMANLCDDLSCPVPKKNLAAYRRMAQKASRIWREFARSTIRNAPAMTST